MAFNMYQGLTHGAYSAIHIHGSAEQKRTYLPKLTTCEWTGTMNLTEPHAARTSDHAHQGRSPTATAATPSPARRSSSPPASTTSRRTSSTSCSPRPRRRRRDQGVSLFIVPKFLVNEDGSLGQAQRAQLRQARAQDGHPRQRHLRDELRRRHGCLLGEEHKGMRAMFTMMNEARLGVALQGYAQAEIAYQNAAAYAKDRPPGPRRDRPQEPGRPCRPDHRPPRRAPLALWTEELRRGRRGLHLLGRYPDRPRPPRGRQGRPTPSSRSSPPCLKGFQTDKGFEMAVAAQQLYGGTATSRNGACRNMSATPASP
jgi:alkylation response protein AidB-like acyl-CoA dehydrogenase